MRILAWNCCGLASARAVRALLEIQKREKPDVIFLSESHLRKVKAEKLRRRVGFDHLILHESDGRGGGSSADVEKGNKNYCKGFFKVLH